MKKLILLLLTLNLKAQVTLSGTLNDPAGNGVTGYLYMTLSQVAALNTDCGGPIEVVPKQLQITVTAGALVTPPTPYGNDCLLPQGTFYNVTFRDGNGNILFTDRWYLSGAAVDVGSIVSVTISGTQAFLGAPGVILTNPVTTQTITQPGATALNVNTLNVTGTFTAPNGASCTGGNCTGFAPSNMVTTDTAQTITGQKSFSAAPLASGAVDLGGSTAPFATVWSDYQVITPNVKVFNGGLIGAPDDFFVLRNFAVHVFQIIDSSSNMVMQYDASGGLPGTWTLEGNILLDGIPQFGGTNSTGSGTTLLGSNSPATVLTAPYTWLEIRTSDGTTAWIPAWK